MTKEAAIFQFWAQFGIAAYEENSVPTGSDSPEFPYITYQVITDSFDTETMLTASIWQRSSSWVSANAKAEDISNFIGRGGRMLKCDGGAIWIKRGIPFAQSIGDETDTFIKRKILNITAEFLTAN